MGIWIHTLYAFDVIAENPGGLSYAVGCSCLLLEGNWPGKAYLHKDVGAYGSD